MVRIVRIFRLRLPVIVAYGRFDLLLWFRLLLLLLLLLLLVLLQLLLSTLLLL